MHSPTGHSVWPKPVTSRDFPGGPVVENPLGNAGDVGSIPGWGTKITITHAMQPGEHKKETSCYPSLILLPPFLL